MNTKTYPCTRCNGKGEIPHHSNVLGGVCFKCGGSGKQESRPAKKQPKFHASAVLKETGERIQFMTFRAPNSERALMRVKVQLADSGYFAETAEVRAA